MLRIKIIAVGKLKEAYFLAAQTEYLKRLKPYIKLEIVETPDLPCPEHYSPTQEEQVLKREADSILRQVTARDYLVVLDRAGEQMNSARFAGLIKEKESSGTAITMVVGGSLGLAQELLDKANLKLSFSEMTFPHQLFRIILLEQIYRAVKINRGEAYHK